jgi:hypothetical protein
MRKILQKRLNAKGQVLVGLVIIMTIVTILVATTTSFLSQMLNLETARIDQARALYAAQAGIYRTIVDYRNTGTVSGATDVQITGNAYYSISADAGNGLRVDSRNPKWLANGRRLRGVIMDNVTSSNIALSSIAVSWSPDNGEQLEKISFIIGFYEWTGTASSGQTITLSYTFTPAGSYVLDLDWATGNDLRNKTITVRFNFSDGSYKIANIIENGQSGDDTITLKATGKVVARDTWKKTFVVTYDVTSQEITSWKESNAHL